MVRIDPGTKLKRVELLGSRIDDELIFFDQQVGRYYATGSVGADVWEILDSPKSVSEICDRLQELYEIDRITCETQLYPFLQDLLETGLVQATPRVDE